MSRDRCLRWGVGLLASATAILAQQPPSASRGIALLIGNARYAGRPLKTTERDAADLAAVLGRLGFETYVETNLTLQGLTTSLTNFARRGINSDVPVVVYYAGHGVQVNGVNYLVPIDTDLNDAADIPRRTFSVGHIFDALRSMGKRPKIVVLDACRGNPFA